MHAPFYAKKHLSIYFRKPYLKTLQPNFPELTLHLTRVYFWVYFDSFIFQTTISFLQWCAIEIIQQVFIKKFQLFWQPSQRSSETNDTSFESPNNKLLESGKILGVASFWGWPRPLNWKSTTFTKTRVEPVMIEILPVSNLLSNGG